MKILATFLMLIGTTLSYASEYQFGEIENDKLTKISFQKDQYGNSHLDLSQFQGQLEKSAVNEVALNIKKFTETIEPGSAIIARASCDNYNLIPLLKAASFEHSFTNNDYSEWVIKNGSPMPDPLTSIGGGFIICLKQVMNEGCQAEKYVLMIEEISRRGRLWLPGGSQEKGEFKYETAIRELKEEVGLETDPKDLIKVASWERKNANRYGANDTADFFLTSVFNGKLIEQGSEVIWAGWLNLSFLLEENKFEGRRLPLVFQNILKHIHNPLSPSTLAIPDFRQMPIKPEDRDPHDLMLLYLNHYDH